MKVYLAGGIWGVKDPITWRRHATEQLPEGWEALDPTQIELFIENEDADENAQKIVDLDLAAIKDSDAMIAMISQPSWGTAMEMFYANNIGVPVIGWNPHPAGRKVGPWVRAHCIMLTSNFEDVKMALQSYRSSFDAALSK